MSDIDISPLFRLVEAALAGNPELQAMAAPLMAAADSDGQPNAEDRVLSDGEIENYVRRLRQESGGNLSILTRNRDQLAGTLADARSRLSSEHASEGLLQLLEIAAAQDEDHENLSAEEIEALVQELTQQDQQARELTPETIVTEVNALLEQLRQTEAEIPEAFVPADEARRRDPIDLNFLKNLPPTVFGGDDDQSIMLQNLLQIAGVDINDRRADWSLSYEELDAFISSLPEEARTGFPDAEVTLANFRFIAFTLREEINAALAEVITGGGDAAVEGIPLQALLDRRSQINDPRVEQLLEVAGPDAVLTALDVERHLQRMERENPGFLQGMLANAPAAAEGEELSDLQRATQLYLAGARALAADYGAEPVTSDGAPSDAAFDRNLYISRQVLGDLQRMRAGFTHRDRQYVEESSLTGTLDFLTWVYSFGGALTWFLGGNPPGLSEEDVAEYGEDILPRVGPTLRHVVRGSVEAHDHERGIALAELRRIIETPPSDFEGERTIPNALEYLRTHPAINEHSDGFDRWIARLNRRYYETLTGDLFQAERLWRIRSETNPARAEEMWFSLAQDLRGGYLSTWRQDAYLDGIDNLDFSRAILHALHRESTDEAMRNRAHHALQDSLGQDVTDDDGNVISEGGGEFGIWPPDWFRNYSDENRDGVASDAVLLTASLLVSGGSFSVARGAMTATGRAALTAGFLRFLGVRGTQIATTTALEGAAAEGTAVSSGWFGRLMTSWAARRVATQEAALAAATTEAETAAARQALARAQAVQRILTSPTILGTAAETVAPNATGWWTRVAAAHPPIGEGLVRTAAGTGTRAALARATVATLENISLRGLGRGLHWLSYEGIVSYGIAGYVFQSAPRHSNHPEVFDREYELRLPEREPPTDPAATP
ncbi:MAG: hypothetical protein U1F66_05065 [bacterium]